MIPATTALHASISSTMKCLVAAYLLCLAGGGAVWFWSAEPSETPLFVPGENSASDEVPGPVNWASYRKGARARVSSWDPFRSHHPMFAIDEMVDPPREAKWQSDVRDRSPWIEVTFAQPIRLRKIQLDFAGTVESPKQNMMHYRIRCFAASGTSTSISTRDAQEIDVRQNRDSRTEHLFDCPSTTSVRVDFDVDQVGQPRDRVRLYEIRVFGEGA